MESATARSQMTSGRKPNMNLQITSLDVILFYLVPTISSPSVKKVSFWPAEQWTQCTERLTYLRWMMTKNLDILTNEINVLAAVAYLIIGKITVRSKILLLLHISPLFILLSFLVTTTPLKSRCCSLLFNMKNEKYIYWNCYRNAEMHLLYFQTLLIINIIPESWCWSIMFRVIKYLQMVNPKLVLYHLYMFLY